MYHSSRHTTISKPEAIIGILFSVISGTLLHFIFQWSMKNPAVAIIGAVNESTWEHLKLLFFPVLLYTVFECLLHGNSCVNFLWPRTLSLLTGMAFIVIGFYSYSGIMGRNYLIADIALFIGGVIISFILTPFICKKLRNPAAYAILSIFILLCMTALFAVFTFYPPHLGLFLDPSSHSYGI